MSSKPRKPRAAIPVPTQREFNAAAKRGAKVAADLGQRLSSLTFGGVSLSFAPLLGPPANGNGAEPPDTPDELRKML
jgi:hypothetical protein